VQVLSFAADGVRTRNRRWPAALARKDEPMARRGSDGPAGVPGPYVEDLESAEQSTLQLWKELHNLRNILRRAVYMPEEDPPAPEEPAVHDLEALAAHQAALVAWAGEVDRLQAMRRTGTPRALSAWLRKAKATLADKVAQIRKTERWVIRERRGHLYTHPWREYPSATTMVREIAEDMVRRIEQFLTGGPDYQSRDYEEMSYWVTCNDRLEDWGGVRDAVIREHAEILPLCRERGTADELASFPYGVLVNKTKRTLQRKGYRAIVDVSSPLRWHILMVVLDAAPGQVPLEKLRTGYPGEWEARGPAVSDLNRRLKPLKIKVENRTLQTLD
jgi:hypothetical protein